MLGQNPRVGIIGVGMMGGDHAERIAHRLANSTLVAVSDPDTERAHALADRFEGVRTVGVPSTDGSANPSVRG
jgi:myo-inositol 2-dehydrogenase / D-chiro-inositol 1-dehydrogenase